MLIMLTFIFQIVGATEEVEGEEVHDGVANVLTALGHFVQTPSGQMVKVEPDIEYDDSVIYRYVLQMYSYRKCNYFAAIRAVFQVNINCI